MHIVDRLEVAEGVEAEEEAITIKVVEVIFTRRLNIVIMQAATIPPRQ
jgi:hypothetical protein